jgi:hypothetical protein
MKSIRFEVLAQRHGLTLAESFLEGKNHETRVYRASGVALTVHNHSHYSGVDSTWCLYGGGRVLSMGHEEMHLACALRLV